jgi:putative transposase
MAVRESPVKWVSDITYIRTGEGWLYLTVIMDLADRKIIGWSMDNSMSASSTVVDAWKMAIKNRPLDGELIFHSDRGIQYASNEFRRCLKGLPVLQSMSRKGNCWDNAIAESFFKTPITIGNLYLSQKGTLKNIMIKNFLKIKRKVILQMNF